MKSILMSIKPKWVAKILNGEKTIEIRKRFPKDYVGWVYIYCTKDKKYANLINRGGFLTGMVVARFWCDKVEEMYYCDEQYLKPSCLSIHEMFDYLKDKNGYAITKLEIFDKPREISEFKYYKKFSEIDYMLPIPRKEACKRLVALTRAPQSYCFIEI